MSRYRKILVQTWASESFLRLSSAKPCGEGCFFHLLTGRHTTAIPGLFSAGEAALAESRRWPLAAWRKAFSEVEREGIAIADWKAPLVYLPRALALNPPANPNVVRSWKDEWAVMPGCNLKDQAAWEMGAFLEAFGKGFGEAFAYVTGKPFDKSSPKPFEETSAKSSGNAFSRTRTRARTAPAPDPVQGGVQGGWQPDPSWGDLPPRLFGRANVEGLDLDDTAPDLATLRRAWVACVSALGVMATSLDFDDQHQALGAIWSAAAADFQGELTVGRWMAALAHAEGPLQVWREEQGGHLKAWKPKAFTVWVNAPDEHEVQARPSPPLESHHQNPTAEELAGL